MERAQTMVTNKLPSHKSCSTAAAEGPQRVVVMKLQWNCDYMDATFSHLKAELCLTAAIYAVVNQVCGNHRWEITASVIGKSIKHRDHFKQVSAGLWGVLQGDYRGISLIHSLIDLMSCGNRQRKIWEYRWGSDSKRLYTARTPMLVDHENEFCNGSSF